MNVQYDLFESVDATFILEKRIEELEDALNKLRKRYFAEKGEFSKAFAEVLNRMESLEKKPY